MELTIQLCRKVRHSLADLNLLGADLLTAPAADTGGRLLVLWQSGQGHRRDEPAAGETVLVLEL